MTNYYYIIASLPAISQDWKFGDRTAEGLIGEIKALSTQRDLDTIGLVESGFDADSLNEDFYRKALSHRTPFIREFYTFDLNVRNAKARFLNRALGREPEKDVILLREDGQEQPADFPEAARIEAILQDKDILSRERAIDTLYWNRLDEMTVGHYFDMDVILAFILKLHIIDRWHLLDEGTGREMFRKLVEEVTATFKGVEYDPKGNGTTDNNIKEE